METSIYLIALMIWLDLRGSSLANLNAVPGMRILLAIKDCYYARLLNVLVLCFAGQQRADFRV